MFRFIYTFFFFGERFADSAQQTNDCSGGGEERDGVEREEEKIVYYLTENIQNEGRRSTKCVYKKNVKLKYTRKESAEIILKALIHQTNKRLKFRAFFDLNASSSRARERERFRLCRHVDAMLKISKTSSRSDDSGWSNVFMAEMPSNRLRLSIG